MVSEYDNTPADVFLDSRIAFSHVVSGYSIVAPRRRACFINVPVIPSNCVCGWTRILAAMCSGGHLLSSQPSAFFPRFVETAQVSHHVVIGILWSSACLTPFQTLDRNRAAGKEEEI
jgi:hypothetical protein